MKFDWKFALSILAAIAGIVVPIWLWQFDLKSSSVIIKLTSSVSLQPENRNSIPDLKLMIAGAEISSPYLSTIELINDGSKPIPASSFEGPIEITSDKSSTLIRARILSSNPTDLQPVIEYSDQSITLKPLLLNPKDSITIAILTSGTQPNFAGRARIAGITKIIYEDQTPKIAKWKIFSFYLPIAFLSLTTYFIFALELIRPGSFTLSRPLTAIIMLISVVGGSSIVKISYESLGLEAENISRTSFMLITSIVGTAVVYYLLRRSQKRSGA